MGPWKANWTTRYIGRITLGYANPCLGPSACRNTTAPTGCNDYANPAGRGICTTARSRITTRRSATTSSRSTRSCGLGVDNIFDKQPPLLYLNNVLNANTDVSTYDLLGRYYHASVTVKF